jgi:hypothetical protein
MMLKCAIYDVPGNQVDLDLLLALIEMRYGWIEDSPLDLILSPSFSRCIVLRSYGPLGQTLLHFSR